MSIFYLILIGLCAGLLSGLIGVGGGIVMIPALVFLFGIPQQLAQGTTLAVFIPPVGILAAWIYYQKGFVDLKMAAIICIGFIIGSFFGAKYAVALPTQVLQKAFGGFLLLIALKMLLGK